MPGTDIAQGKTMNQIHAFKKRYPEVWEEEEKCRMDQVANMAVGSPRSASCLAPFPLPPRSALLTPTCFLARVSDSLHAC
eukprot:839594-Rhodomonas_salina.2